MQQCVDVEMTHGFLTVKNPYNLLSEIFVSAGMCEWILAMCYEETFTNVSSVLYKCPVLPNGIGKAMKEFHLWDAKFSFAPVKVLLALRIVSLCTWNSRSDASILYMDESVWTGLWD